MKTINAMSKLLEIAFIVSDIFADNAKVPKNINLSHLIHTNSLPNTEGLKYGPVLVAALMEVHGLWKATDSYYQIEVQSEDELTCVFRTESMEEASEVELFLNLAIKNACFNDLSLLNKYELTFEETKFWIPLHTLELFLTFKQNDYLNEIISFSKHQVFKATDYYKGAEKDSILRIEEQTWDAVSTNVPTFWTIYAMMEDGRSMAIVDCNLEMDANAYFERFGLLLIDGIFSYHKDNRPLFGLTTNVRTTRNVPLKLMGDYPEFLEVRGEKPECASEEELQELYTRDDIYDAFNIGLQMIAVTGDKVINVLSLRSIVETAPDVWTKVDELPDGNTPPVEKILLGIFLEFDNKTEVLMHKCGIDYGQKLLDSITGMMLSLETMSLITHTYLEQSTQGDMVTDTTSRAASLVNAYVDLKEKYDDVVLGSITGVSDTGEGGHCIMDLTGTAVATITMPVEDIEWLLNHNIIGKGRDAQPVSEEAIHAEMVELALLDDDVKTCINIISKVKGCHITAVDVHKVFRTGPDECTRIEDMPIGLDFDEDGDIGLYVTVAAKDILVHVIENRPIGNELDKLMIFTTLLADHNLCSTSYPDNIKDSFVIKEEHFNPVAIAYTEYKLRMDYGLIVNDITHAYTNDYGTTVLVTEGMYKETEARDINFTYLGHLFRMGLIGTSSGISIVEGVQWSATFRESISDFYETGRSDDEYIKTLASYSTSPVLSYTVSITIISSCKCNLIVGTDSGIYKHKLEIGFNMTDFAVSDSSSIHLATDSDGASINSVTITNTTKGTLIRYVDVEEVKNYETSIRFFSNGEGKVLIETDEGPKSFDIEEGANVISFTVTNTKYIRVYSSHEGISIEDFDLKEL